MIEVTGLSVDVGRLQVAVLRREGIQPVVRQNDRLGVLQFGEDARLEDEVGDLFFVLVNIARYLSLDPESALRKTNRKFRRRFRWMEDRLHAAGTTAESASMDELESLWRQAKQQEKPA